MLRWRLILGVVFIATVAGLCALDLQSNTVGIWLLPLALLIAVLGTQELIAMFGKRGWEVNRPLAYAGNLLLVLVAYKYHVASFLSWFVESASPALRQIVHTLWLEFAASALALLFLAIMLAEIQRYRGDGQAPVRMGATLFTLAYLGVLLGFLADLRSLHGGNFGLLPLASLIVVVKLCDIGAYTVGRLIGRHKMTPRLSPGKTWEGAVGGIAFGCFGAWLTIELGRAWLMGPNHDASLPIKVSSTAVVGILPRSWMAYGMVVSVAGIVGDLAESLLKRECGVKDSSTWMPGFGGVLDIVDSILFAAPVAYFCWQVFMLGY